MGKKGSVTYDELQMQYACIEGDWALIKRLERSSASYYKQIGGEDTEYTHEGQTGTVKIETGYRSGGASAYKEVEWNPETGVVKNFHESRSSWKTEDYSINGQDSRRNRSVSVNVYKSVYIDYVDPSKSDTTGEQSITVTEPNKITTTQKVWGHEEIEAESEEVHTKKFLRWDLSIAASYSNPDYPCNVSVSGTSYVNLMTANVGDTYRDKLYLAESYLDHARGSGVPAECM